MKTPEHMPASVTVALATIGVVLAFAPSALAQTRFGSTSLAAGDSPAAVAPGDFNGDSDLDLAVANQGSDNVSLLLGNGSGGFAPASNFGVGDGPVAVAAGDMNLDGRADLAVANSASDTVSSLFGSSSSGFGPTSSFSVGDEPVSVAMARLNQDSWGDLAVANRLSDDASVLLGDGSRGFGTASQLPAGTRPQSITAEILNVGSGLDESVDASPDLAVAGGGVLSLLTGDGNGSFGAPTSLAAGTDPISVAVADVTRDNLYDLISLDAGSGSIATNVASAGGGYAPPVRSGPVGTALRSLAVGNIDNDGIPDLAVVNEDPGYVAVLLGTGSGGYAPATNVPTGELPQSLAIGDFDEDGDGDLAVANRGSDSVSVLINGPAQDTAPPKLNVPGTITADAASPTGAVVAYGATSTDDLDSNPGVSCEPASGTTFPIGTTGVACVATDSAGNQAQASFDVFVKGAAAQISDLSAQIRFINLKQGIANSLDAKLQGILDALSSVKGDQKTSACNRLDAVTGEINAQSGKDIPMSHANALLADIARIKAVLICP